MMEKIKVESAVGMILGHDLTQIIPEQYKGCRFKKGHIINKADIEILKKMGKDHIYSFKLEDDEYHEEAAALKIANAITGSNLTFSDPSEGKIELKAVSKGLLKVDKDILDKVNNLEQIIISTLHNDTLVEVGQVVAATKVIPLKIKQDKLKPLDEICQDSLISIKPLEKKRAGAIITGNEVYYKRIEDAFAPVFQTKADKYNLSLEDIKYTPDDKQKIVRAIDELIKKELDIIFIAGGMSVDPDDLTPVAIKASGAQIESYGSPLLPGAMLMLAYKEDITIFGIPACAMFSEITALDILLAKIVAGEKVSKSYINSLGHGGLCLGCSDCRYPVCPLGKGGF